MLGFLLHLTCPHALPRGWPIIEVQYLLAVHVERTAPFFGEVVESDLKMKVAIIGIASVLILRILIPT